MQQSTGGSRHSEVQPYGCVVAMDSQQGTAGGDGLATASSIGDGGGDSFGSFQTSNKESEKQQSTSVTDKVSTNCGRGSALA